MKETPAKLVTGHILYDVANNKHFFRIYHKDRLGVCSYYDYDLAAEDIQIQIQSDDLSLFEGETNKLDWSTRTLTPQPGDRVTRVVRNEGVRTEIHGHYNDKLEFVPE